MLIASLPKVRFVFGYGRSPLNNGGFPLRHFPFGLVFVADDFEFCRIATSRFRDCDLFGVYCCSGRSLSIVESHGHWFFGLCLPEDRIIVPKSLHRFGILHRPEFVALLLEIDHVVCRYGARTRLIVIGIHLGNGHRSGVRSDTPGEKEKDAKGTELDKSRHSR